MASSIKSWLERFGIISQSKILHNPDPSLLMEISQKEEGSLLTREGALGAVTTPYTGRSPNDKYIVDDQERSDLWWGNVNQRISREHFGQLQDGITAYLSDKNLYIIDCYIGSDDKYRLSIRIVTELAWQAIAVQNLFIYDGQPLMNDPDMIVLAAPNFYNQTEIDQIKSRAAIMIDLQEKTVLISGSKYVGEIKKSAFTIMNAILPKFNVLPMHCSANVGPDDDVALYFGLSGTGKTTLSSTPNRRLIGDDEHGWGENGIFNFEGGCYAKVIRLNKDHEPVIWQAANQYGTVLENVVIDPVSRIAEFDNDLYTENSRAAYPLDQLSNVMPEGMGGHPNNIFFLTADAFGVLPPLARLDQDQAIYYFLSGYTSKIAGTERGLTKGPKATFSTCFGEPFLPLTPNIYAKLLKEKIDKHDCQIWLINTGWTGGDYSTGHRMPIPHTRRMINWILNGNDINSNYHIDPFFHLEVPDTIPGIPQELLYPQKTWQDQAAFNRIAEILVHDFENNYRKFSMFSNISLPDM